MGIQFPIAPLHGAQYTPPGIPVTWQYDIGRLAWRVVRGGTAWIDITGKPATFPPSPHQHPIIDVTGLQAILDVKQDISARAQADGYASLDSTAKIPRNQLPDGLGLTWDDIANKPSEFPPSPHSHPVAQISDSSSVGQQLVRAPDAFAARNVIGAIGIDDNARVAIKNGGTVIGVRRGLNFVAGTNTTLLITDDVANEDVDVVINASGGSGGSALLVTEVKPSAPADSTLWLDVATGILFIYYNDGVRKQWIEAMPYLASMPAAFTKFMFPAAPTDGQLYNPIPGATWKWSSTRGVWFAALGAPTSYTKAESDANFVDIIGDTMTGALTLYGDPTANLQAATKQYVDNKPSVYISDTPPAGAPDRSLWWESDSGLLFVRYNDGTGSQWIIAAPQPDFSIYVSKGGDTMTGALTLAADPTAALHSATKQYVDAGDMAGLAASGMQINGSMEVSQERGLTATSVTNSFICDGWRLVNTAAVAVVSGSIAPTNNFVPGFTSHMQIAVTTAQASLSGSEQVGVLHRIEGYRVIRVGFGAAYAQPITIAFQTAHGRTGVYSVSIRNSDDSRSYTATYTQNAASTWEFKTITVPGDVAGTWLRDNSSGISVHFMVACGPTLTAPSANTWYGVTYVAAPGQVNAVATTSDIFRITGVVVLPGAHTLTAAQSPLLMRPYDQELRMCQRYSQWVACNAYFTASAAGYGFSTPVNYPAMRALPTAGNLLADPAVSGAGVANLNSALLNYMAINGASLSLASLAAGSGYIVGYRSFLDARL